MAPVSRRSRPSSGARPSTVADIEWVLAGRASLGGRIQPVEIGVDPNGRISAIGKDLPGPRRHDVGDRIIVPSGSDLHVHLREPGGSNDVESFAAGTIEAAVGGIGLVGEMPNTVPPVTDVDRFEAKAALARGRLAVDLVLYALAAPSVPIEELGRRAGAFKLYASPTTGVSDVPSPEELPPLLQRVAATDLPISVHAEAPDRFASEPTPSTLEEWDRARPVGAEQLAVDRILGAAPATLRLSFAHVTQAEMAERIRKAGFASEATVHHLLLGRAIPLPTHGKVNPPLRTEATRLALWTGFLAGALDWVASDHAPHASAAKDRPFAQAPSGIPGLETGLPILLERVRAQELSLDRLVQAVCDRPARWMGQPRGRIAPGHAADLLVVDFRRRHPIAPRSLHAPCGWSPYEGWPAIFPVEHFRRGERIVEEGEYVGSARGEIVRPEYARPSHEGPGPP